MSPPGIHAGDVTLIGIACDARSSFMRGPALAPARIRRVLHSGASGLTAETARRSSTIRAFATWAIGTSTTATTASWRSSRSTRRCSTPAHAR